MNTNVHSMYLTGHGELEWGEVVQLLEGFTCAWADYDGFHVERRCPIQAPPYSHLWAWNQDSSRLLRVRIDDGKGIVGELSEASSVGEAGGRQKPVRVRITGCIPWGADQRIGRKLAPDVAHGKFRRFEPVIPLSATFIGGPAPRESHVDQASCASARPDKACSSQDSVDVDGVGRRPPEQ